MPMTIAVSVESHTTGSWMMPSAISASLSSPSRCRMLIQA